MCLNALARSGLKFACVTGVLVAVSEVELRVTSAVVGIDNSSLGTLQKLLTLASFLVPFWISPIPEHSGMQQYKHCFSAFFTYSLVLFC